MVKPQSRRSGGQEMKMAGLKPILKKRTLDFDLLDHFLNEKDPQIFDANGWLNYTPTAEDLISVDPDDSLQEEKKAAECLDELIFSDLELMDDDPIWVDTEFLTHGSGDDQESLNTDTTRCVTSPEFEIWSPTPDYSGGFDAAEYFLNFLTPFEDETNFNPSLPDEQPD